MDKNKEIDRQINRQIDRQIQKNLLEKQIDNSKNRTQLIMINIEMKCNYHDGVRVMPC